MFNTLRVITAGLVLLLCYPSNIEAKSISKEQGHFHGTHKTAVGIHGMALFTDGETLYASHMPLANSIHAHQVIFSFSLSEGSEQALKTMLANNALVSLMPERFDLMKLIEGELLSFKGQLFAGHFERGGKKVLHQVTVNVKKVLLSTDLASDIKDNGTFFFIKTKGKNGLLVHRIVASPSFDQIIQATLVSQADSLNEKPLLLTLTNGAPIVYVKPRLIDDKGIRVKLGTPLYLETKDFQ